MHNYNRVFKCTVGCKTLSSWTDRPSTVSLNFFTQSFIVDGNHSAGLKTKFFVQMFFPFSLEVHSREPPRYGDQLVPRPHEPPHLRRPPHRQPSLRGGRQEGRVRDVRHRPGRGSGRRKRIRLRNGGEGFVGNR